MELLLLVKKKIDGLHRTFDPRQLIVLEA